MRKFGLFLLFVAGCSADADGDGFRAKDDCNDDNADIRPDADEICDGIDNNCDGDIDSDAIDAPVYYGDGDADGYGSIDSELRSCELPSGYVTDNSDCHDADPTIYPGAIELCDGVDQDCDDVIDNDAGTTFYEDNDSDGFGDPDTAQASCDGDGLVANGTDCDDDDAAINPGQAEICDDIDNDCDGLIDDDDSSVQATTWYADVDADGYGDPNTGVVTCDPVGTWVENGDDCDDGNSGINPGQPEVCGGGDEDCDGAIDDDDDDVTGTTAWAVDGDGDGYGGPKSLDACVQPKGTVETADDCDDGDPEVHPDATEICDGDDEDCDKLVDDADPDIQFTFYEDLDGDGYGTSPFLANSCDAPKGYAAVDGDCDDRDGTINPGRLELCFDGIDNDCDGSAGSCRLTGTVDAATDADLIVYGAANDGLGYTYSAGPMDLDGDGNDDLVIGAPGIPWWGVAAGGVYAWHGPVPSGTLDATTDSELLLAGVNAGSLAGISIARIDLDDDGFDDIVVGAPGQDDATQGGVVYVHFGTGVQQAGVVDLGSADLTIQGPAPSSWFGYSLANVGDVNGDGADDLAIGSPGNLASAGASSPGEVYVVYAGTLPPNPMVNIGALADAVITGTDASQNIGVSVSGGHDLDGDLRDDLVIGGPGGHWWTKSYTYSGSALVFFGPIAGALSSSDADFEVTSVDLVDTAGVFVAAVADLDDDGDAELIVGASGDTTGGTDAGKAGIFWGPLGTGSETIDDADVLIIGTTSFSWVGEGLSVGDFDLDGSHDLIVSGWASGAYLFYGPLTDGAWFDTDADLIVESSAMGSSFGSSSMFGGDLDGDGWDDLIVTDPADTVGGGDSGTAYILRGRSL